MGKMLPEVVVVLCVSGSIAPSPNCFYDGETCLCPLR